MTKVTIQIADNSKLPLVLATLQRLASAGGLEFAVEEPGQTPTLDTSSDDAQFAATVNQIVADAMAGKLAPLAGEEARRTAEYWEKVGTELNLTDDDIVRLVKECRAEDHAKSAA